MSGMWIGSIVSIDCGNVLGIFEGEISNIDSVNQTISLINVSRNAVRSKVPEVTLRTLDIKNLKLIESTVSKNHTANYNNIGDKSTTSTPSASKPAMTNGSPLIEDNPKKKGEGKKKAAKRLEAKKLKEHDEAFNDDVLDNEFDFEKNLALFDKRAVLDEINALSKTDRIRLVDCNVRCPAKYRHDENVLCSEIPILKQISVPCLCEKEYVTDTGLVVPSVTIDFKKRLYEKSEELGLIPKVRVEMIGRGACEMVLHLVGGSHRLNPQNNHQKPNVVILCGSHIQGIQGVNCARQLANHCVVTTVLSPPQAKESHSVSVANELKLFHLSCGKSVNVTSNLPTSVDLIVDALQSHQPPNPAHKSWLSTARQWMKQSKAPVLSLDPPPDCDSSEFNFILSPALPFAFNNDKCSIHICDIGLPRGVFTAIGCKYSPPFGSKFVVPLYPRSEST